MERTRAFVVAIATLLAAALPVSCVDTITTTFTSNQATAQPELGTSPSFLCRVDMLPFVRAGTTVSFYKRQPDSAWVQIASGSTPLNDRFKLDRITQNVATEDGFTLTIKNFQPSDAGSYLCNVSLANAAEGVASAELSVAVATQLATVTVTTSVTELVDGAYVYDSHAVTTTCTVDVVSMSDVNVKVLYNKLDHTSDFLATPTSTWVGSVNGMKEPRKHVTLVSQTFRPSSRTPQAVECIVTGQDGSQLGQGSINVARKTLPRIECEQSGHPPAYLNDLDVMITCKVQDYDWILGTSHFSWSFTTTDGEKEMIVTVDDPKVGKADRRIVEDSTNGKHSLLINKVTSDAARYTVYTIALKEGQDELTTTTFTLQVLNRSRASETGSTSASPSAVAAGTLVLLLVALQLLL